MPDFGWESDVEAADDEDEEAEGAPEDDSSTEEVETPSEDTEATESDSDPAPVDDTEEETNDDSEDADPVEIDADDGDPFADLAGDSLDLTEARDREHLRRVLLWGPEGTAKTHNVYTSATPLAIIDTEDKAHDLADNFDLDPAKVRLWQPTNYPEARQALDQAMEWLGAWLDQRGERGTLAVDSMTDIWDWSKNYYIEQYYIEPDPTGKYEDPSDVDLKSSLQSNDPDWPKIKQYHNDKFREPMVQSPFHLTWTAKATEDFGEKMERGLSVTPLKPAGEKDNPYKVSHLVRLVSGSEGQPVAIYEKPGVTQHTFAGLEWPTLPKIFEVVEDIQEAENSPEDVPPTEVTDYDVEIIKGKPSRLRGLSSGGDDDGD